MKGFMPICVYILFAAFLFSSTISAGQTDLTRLYETAKKYSETEYQIRKADSISQEAVSIAQASLDDNILHEALLAYLTRDEYGHRTVVPTKYLNLASKIAEELPDPAKKLELWIILSQQLLYQNKLNEGSELARRALSYAASTPSPKIKAQAYIASARAARATNQVKEAWQNLLNAQNFIDKLDSKDKVHFKEVLTDELIDFHASVNNYDKAQETVQEKLNSVLKAEPIDSLKYMWTMYELCALISTNETDIRLDDKVNSILAFAKQTKNETLFHYASALNRNYLINNFRLSEFHEQYADKYDLRLAEFDKPTKEAEYCLSNALFCEYQSRVDSAITLYERALTAAGKTNNGYRLANYHRRYGEFLLRNGMREKAYIQLKESLKLSQDNNYYTNILDVIEPLDSLARYFKDFKTAYQFADYKLKANAYLSFQQEKENLLIMELENEREQNEIRQLEAYEAEKKKFNLQYFAIAIALTTFFLILMIISSMAVPAWLIDMLGFFSILFIFEFVILILDHKIHHWAHGEPMKIFIVKIIILSVLYPIHHVIEHGVTSYMKKNQLIKRPKASAFRNILAKLYPWLNKEDNGH